MTSKTGKIKWFDNQKGYGFILSNDGDVFVHINALRKTGIDTLNEDDLVSYDLSEHNGKKQAVNVNIVYED